MWLLAVYHQVSLFSLKPADATSTGGRSLLVPTPFSIKMALLDGALRLYGTEAGSQHFELLRDLTIAISPPPQIVVNNCFMRIHKPRREKSGPGEAADTSGDEEQQTTPGPFIRTVAFREYVYYNGPLALGVELKDEQHIDVLTTLFAQVTYLGKRGGFFQLDSPPQTSADLPVRQGYVLITTPADASSTDAAPAILQVLDDCGPTLDFTRASVYAERSRSTAIRLGKERILRHVVLPYRLARSSRGFSLYARIS